MFGCNLPPALWQNDQDLLCATAVTRGWNGYQNKSQHRKSTLERKILPTLLQGFEPTTFESWVRWSNHWAIPAWSNKQTLTEFWVSHQHFKSPTVMVFKIVHAVPLSFCFFILDTLHVCCILHTCLSFRLFRHCCTVITSVSGAGSVW